MEAECRFGNRCHRADCQFKHPTTRQTSAANCKFGLACNRRDCYFAHPAGWIFENLGQPFVPDCRYGLNCYRANCYFAHPPGWKYATGNDEENKENIEIAPSFIYTSEIGCPYIRNQRELLLSQLVEARALLQLQSLQFNFGYQVEDDDDDDEDEDEDEDEEDEEEEEEEEEEDDEDDEEDNDDDDDEDDEDDYESGDEEIRGVSKSFLSKLPRTTFTKKAEECFMCTICQEDYEIGSTLLFLNCIHHFHETCISKWLNKNNTCPNCKLKVERY